MPGEIREIAGFFYREGAVDRKTYNLAALAAMVAVRCDHCIPQRMAAATQAGASSDEVNEMIALGMRAVARASWSTVSAVLPLSEARNAAWKALYERETGRPAPPTPGID